MVSVSTEIPRTSAVITNEEGKAGIFRDFQNTVLDLLASLGSENTVEIFARLFRRSEEEIIDLRRIAGEAHGSDVEEKWYLKAEETRRRLKTS